LHILLPLLLWYLIHLFGDHEMSGLITLSNTLADRFGMGSDANLVQTLKQTAFKGEATEAQLTALLIVANQYGLNPFTKEIYAFPDKNNGIVPVVGIDGWSRIINENKTLDGIEFAQSDVMVTMEGAKPCPEWIECIISRKDREKPIRVREYLDETYRAQFTSKYGSTVTGAWQTHTKRMLRHKALIQCARLAFGYVGIFDEDEYQRIKEAQDVKPLPIVQMNDSQIADWIEAAKTSENLDALASVWQEGNKAFLDNKTNNKDFKDAVKERRAYLEKLEKEKTITDVEPKENNE